MFPTLYVPTALFGLTEVSRTPVASMIDLTPVVIALAIGAFVIWAGRWLHYRQEATPLGRPRPVRSRGRAPLTATA